MNFKISILPIVTLGLASSVFYGSLANESNASVSLSQNRQDDTNVKQYDFSTWNQSIKQSSEDENIKIFITSDASLPYQEDVLAAEYMILDNVNKNGSTDDSIMFFYDYDIYAQNKWDIKDWENKYENKDGSNFQVITNTNELDSSYNTNYKLSPASIASDLVSYLNTKYNDNYSIDLWINDVSLEDFYTSSVDTYELMRHVDKVYVLTDGNYQAYYFINYAIQRYQTPGYVQLTPEEIDQKWENYRNDNNDSYKSDYDSYSIYDFINDGNIFTFFYTHSYTDSPYYGDLLPNGVSLYKTYDIDYNYYDFITKNISDTSEQQTFINDYESFFWISGKTSFTDFFERNSDDFDSSKKNAIWFGSSLITDADQVYPQKTKELQGITQSWLKLFPTSDYNFIVQSHPRYTFDQDIQLTKWYINSDDDSNIIYFNSVPWEMFLSWNYKMQQINGDTYTGIFSQNFAKGVDTVFFGFQFTSTVIQTTAFFLQDFYNYTLDEIEQTLTPYYFPILETCDEVTRTTSFSVSPEDQLEKNEQIINSIYMPFVELNAYPDYRKDWISATDFIRQNYDPNYSIELNIPNKVSNVNGLSTADKVLIGVLVPVAVIAIAVGIYFIVRYNKYKKFRRLEYRKK